MPTDRIHRHLDELFAKDRPLPEILDKARREVAEYQRFRDPVGQVTEVNGAICDARPVTPGSAGDEDSSGTGGKGGS